LISSLQSLVRDTSNGTTQEDAMNNDTTTFEQELAKLKAEFPNAPVDLLESLADLAAYPLEKF
jgi:hypothetical protein